MGAALKKKGPRRIRIDALRKPNEAVRSAVAAYFDELPDFVRFDSAQVANDNGEQREDANETAILAGALTQTAMEAIAYDYPDNMFRELAPLQDGIDEGADYFTWDEYDTVGWAKIIANGADDIPNVSQYVKSNKGQVQSYAIAYSFTDQDIRRAALARRTGRQAIVLDPDKAIAAREVAERTKDRDAALGVPNFGIPGFFRNGNVTVIQAGLPATGSNRSWRMGDKIGREVLAELRLGVRSVATQSKGAHRCTHIVMGIEMLEYIATMPLLATGDNQTTVLAEFLRSQNEMGRPVKIIGWNRASTSNTAGTGDRVMFFKRAKDCLALVEPMIFRSTAPERRGLSTVVHNETRFGGIFFKKPLSAVAMDFV